jgi:hypothetical protein
VTFWENNNNTSLGWHSQTTLALLAGRWKGKKTGKNVCYWNFANIVSGFFVVSWIFSYNIVGRFQDVEEITWEIIVIDGDSKTPDSVNFLIKFKWIEWSRSRFQKFRSWKILGSLSFDEKCQISYVMVAYTRWKSTTREDNQPLKFIISWHRWWTVSSRIRWMCLLSFPMKSISQIHINHPY